MSYVFSDKKNVIKIIIHITTLRIYLMNLWLFELQWNTLSFPKFSDWIITFGFVVFVITEKSLSLGLFTFFWILSSEKDVFLATLGFLLETPPEELSLTDFFWDINTNNQNEI